MTQIINSAGGVGDHGHNPFQHEPEPPHPKAEPAPPPAPADDVADVRLIIESDAAAGGFTYTTIDRRTGAVIRQLPRDGLLKLGEAPDYAAGSLIKARV
ncbi:MAG TPA: hypothetical protein VHZ26_18215 [Caulobacteraceae bacterium]|jgi:hypothetical protein|nr:hypothetical protein [Caulobacteraceae bacterium]